jgi:ribulose kinase
MTRYYLGIDVGTGCARAGIFDAQGVRVGLGTRAIQLWTPRADFVEQSSEDIWQACGEAVRAALNEAAIAAEEVRGIGFDATCSLVLLDADDQPVTVSPSGRAEQNVIVFGDWGVTRRDRARARPRRGAFGSRPARGEQSLRSAQH